MESAYTKTVYFDMFDAKQTIRKKLNSIPGMYGLKFDNAFSKIKRDLNVTGYSSINYIQHGYGVTSQIDQDPLQRIRMNANNYSGIDNSGIIDSGITIKYKTEQEQTNKKLLLL